MESTVDGMVKRITEAKNEAVKRGIEANVCVINEKYEHPCQMPIQIMENIVGIIPNRDEIVVYDPFMGTCTTGLACKRLGIDFIGTEIDEKYFKISQDRMNGILPNGQATLF